MDTKDNIDFASTGKSFFHKPISELSAPTLLTGSKMDDYCNHPDNIFGELKKKNNSLEIHLFDKGNHPAMLTNKDEFLELIKEKIKKTVIYRIHNNNS
jgi:valacyclovir hydrolase